MDLASKLGAQLAPPAPFGLWALELKSRIAGLWNGAVSPLELHQVSPQPGCTFA